MVLCRRFEIYDEAHAESQSDHDTFESAITELKRMAQIPWDQEPNQAPCTSWKTCGRRYEIIPYVRLGDWIVGPENAAPRDAAAAYWVPNPPFNSAHWGAPLDPRIVADIARRLRGEAPFTTTQPAALPAS